jgi:hypothetical protein
MQFPVGGGDVVRVHVRDPFGAVAPMKRLIATVAA